MLIATVLLTMSGVFAFQLPALPTAYVHFKPKTQLVSKVFHLSANSSVPIKTLNGSSTSSQSGPTGQFCRGESGSCIVSAFDVSPLERQVYINLKSKISQDVQQQLPPGTTQIGSIQYDPQPTEMVNPPEGSTSNTVTVTVTERWSVYYFLNKDARTLAQQLLLRQMQTFGANYVPVDSTIRIGQAVVVPGGFGVPAAGYAEYQFPQSQLDQIKDQIKGKTVSSARSFIAIQAGVDPKTISIRFRSAGSNRIPSNGDTLPADPQRIMLTPDPVTPPPVQLPSGAPTPTDNGNTSSDNGGGPFFP